MADSRRPLPQLALADALAVKYRESRLDGGKTASWRSKDRALTLREEPRFSETCRECKEPALRLVVDVYDEDGNNITPPNANPVFIVTMPEDAEKDPDVAIDGVLSRLADIIGAEAGRAR